MFNFGLDGITTEVDGRVSVDGNDDHSTLPLDNYYMASSGDTTACTIAHTTAHTTVRSTTRTACTTSCSTVRTARTTVARTTVCSAGCQ